MEAQGFPDAVNRPGFPSVLCTPDQPYRQRTTIEIAPS
jgi:aldose 1-epimerase